MARLLRRLWWIPAGLLVASTIAASIGPLWAWVVVLVYATVNLAGTAMVLQEMREQERADRWQLVVKTAFVLQLPLGIIVLVVGGV